MFGRKDKGPKHEHQFNIFVDASNAVFVNGGGDCTNILLKCACGELKHLVFDGHFTKEAIRAAYENAVDETDIAQAAKDTETWLRTLKDNP